MSRCLGKAPLLAAATLAAGPGVLLAQEAAEHDAGGGALFDINLGLSIWTVVIFLALVSVLWKFAWGPILAAAAGREERIQKALDEAAARQAEAVRLAEEHRAHLNDARRQVQEIIAEGKVAGERVRKEIEETARSEAQRILEGARRDIEREKDAALVELRRESVEIALAAAGRLLDHRLDAETDRALVMGYIGDLAGGTGEGAHA